MTESHDHIEAQLRLAKQEVERLTVVLDEARAIYLGLLIARDSERARK